MNKNIVSSIAIVGVVILGIVSIYFSFKKEQIDDTYFRTEYLTGCMEASNYAFCSCSYNSLKKQLGVAELMEVSVEYTKTNILPKEAYTAVAECAKFY